LLIALINIHSLRIFL